MFFPRVFLLDLLHPTLPRSLLLLLLLLLFLPRRNRIRPRLPTGWFNFFCQPSTLTVYLATTTPHDRQGLYRRARPRKRIHHDPRLGLPPRVGLGRQVLDLLLAAHLSVLLLEGGWVLAQMAQPLVPLRRDLDGVEVRAARVLHDAAPAGVGIVGGVAIADVAEFPVGVPLKVEAWERCGCVRCGTVVAVLPYTCTCEERTDEEPFPPW